MPPRKPLLMDKLSEAEQMALAAMTKHPGYPALEKMFMDACDTLNKELIKLDPAMEGYTQKVMALQSQARERNQFCLLVLESIQWHLMASGLTDEKEAV